MEKGGGGRTVNSRLCGAEVMTEGDTAGEEA